MLGSLLGWIAAGLIIGAVARLVMPGRQPIGFLLTIALGIAGALLAGGVTHAFFRTPVNPDAATTLDALWPGWLAAAVGATVVLWLGMGVFRVWRIEKAAPEGSERISRSTMPPSAEVPIRYDAADSLADR